MHEDTRTPDSQAVRQSIIDALATLIAEGEPQPSLGDVAQHAGVSKGAIQHHFTDRRGLMVALASAMIDEFDSVLREAEARDPLPAGRAARAYASAAEQMSSGSKALCIALLRAADMEVTVREQWREWLAAEREHDGAKGSDPVGEIICRLAIDGMWLTDLLGLYELSTRERHAVFDRLRAMTLRDRAA